MAQCPFCGARPEAEPLDALSPQARRDRIAGHVAAKRDDQALAEAERAVAAFPDDAGLRLVLAERCISAKRKLPAEQTLKHVLTAMPHASRVERVAARRMLWPLTYPYKQVDVAEGQRRYHEALALAETGSVEDALVRIEQALLADPFDPDALRDRGRLQARVGRHRAALASFADALEFSPECAGVFGDRAASLRALGLLEDARAEYDAHLRRVPGDEPARRARAEIAARLAAQAAGEAPILRRVRPHDRIAGLSTSCLFGASSDGPDGYFRLAADSTYACPRCGVVAPVDSARLVEHQVTPRAAPISANAAAAFAEVGLAKGFDIACSCGLCARLDYDTTELPARSCEFVAAVREIVELWPARH